MKDYLKIESVEALEVLDSRGNPTVQVYRDDAEKAEEGRKT